MYIYDVAKSLGFSFRQEKNKSKPKVAAICFICEVLEIEFLNSFTQYGSYLFAIGVVFWVSGYFTRKKEEKNKKWFFVKSQ